MHILITGHTGFKGAWLTMMLKMLGHSVSGVSLDPPQNSLFSEAGVASIIEKDFRFDIRDISKLRKAFLEIEPDVVIHLAAQPLVRESYFQPVETFEINVMGTVNVLEAMRGLKRLKGALIVTSDKVYKNRGLLRGYVESDELGGDDPYSASKAASDIAAQSWIRNFSDVPVAIARAGNVIGGGDWAANRIIPDLVRSYSNQKIPTLRFPGAVRPWQHVLDCLNGYIVLVENLVKLDPLSVWNFGPKANEVHTVAELVDSFAEMWGGVGERNWSLESDNDLHEAATLMLDSTKAESLLSWKNKLDFNETIKWTVDWYRSDYKNEASEFSRSQIANFFSMNPAIK